MAASRPGCPRASAGSAGAADAIFACGSVNCTWTPPSVPPNWFGCVATSVPAAAFAPAIVSRPTPPVNEPETVTPPMYEKLWNVTLTACELCVATLAKPP
jgi:hypothetical protein